MALDEPQATDHIFDESGLKFLVDKELLEEVKPITIDFITTPSGSGFSIQSSLSDKGGGGGCGSQGNSCSC